MEKKHDTKNPGKNKVKNTQPASPVHTTKAKAIVDYKKVIPWMNSSFVVAYVAIAIYFLVGINADFLYKIQELSVFLPTKLYFLTHMKSPGGFLSWLGNFFTQFFYFPWLGAFIFILLTLLVQYLLLKSYRISSKYLVLSFLVPFALLLTITQLGYVIYTVKAQGFIYSNLLGFAAVLALMWLHKAIKSVLIRVIYVTLVIALLYPLLGFYALLFALLAMIFELTIWVKTKSKYGYLPVLACILVAIIVPYFYFLAVYTQTEFGRIYLAGLPDVPFVLGAILAFWKPYFAVFAVLVILSFLPIKKSDKPVGVIAVLISCFAFCLYFYFFNKYTFKDENFQTEIAMDRAVFENRWDDVLKLAREQKDEPSRIVVMKTRLALQKLNIAGDKMFNFADGSKRLKNPVPMKLLLLTGKQLYYHYGQTNFCYHWCVEDMVERGIKVEYLRYMVKCSLIKGELQLAQKYNDVLKQTLFHKKWAERYQKYIDDPKLMVNDEEFKSIRPLTAFNNRLDDNYGFLEEDLMNDFAKSDCATPELLDLSLQSTLLIKNSELFWPRYFLYVQTHQRIPVHYQEAALFFSYFERKVDVSGQKFDPQIIDNFKQLLKTCDLNVGKTKEENKINFAPLFANTYWYYYFFATPNMEL